MADSSEQSLRILRPDDWHLHVRDGAQLACVLPFTARQFARAIIMPNLKPPVTTVAMAAAYRDRILAALPAGTGFEPLMTLYLTDTTSPQEIRTAKSSGFIAGAKLYPAGATTHSDAGVTAIEKIYPALEAMEACGLVFQVHGEVTDGDVDVFDRERVFIERILTKVVERFPELRIVFEHVTTREAVQFVKGARRGVGATITPQHLLLNRNAIFQGGIRPHNYCLPVLKREHDRRALIEAATATMHASSSAPTARRMHSIRRKRAAVAPESSLRTRPSSCTRKPSRRQASSSGSKRSLPSAARTSTACRAIASTSRWSAPRGRRRLRILSTVTSWCRFAQANRLRGAWSRSSVRERPTTSRQPLPRFHARRDRCRVRRLQSEHGCAAGNCSGADRAAA